MKLMHGNRSIRDLFTLLLSTMISHTPSERNSVRKLSESEKKNCILCATVINRSDSNDKIVNIVSILASYVVGTFCLVAFSCA